MISKIFSFNRLIVPFLAFFLICCHKDTYVEVLFEGEVKISGKAQNGKVTLNISHLPQGAYFIVIDTGIKPETHELIIN